VKLKPVWGVESGVNPNTNEEVTVEDAGRSKAKKHFIRDGLLRFVDIWKGGCERSAEYREKMAAYVQYWAPTTLQFGFWPSTDWTRTHVPDPLTASEIARDIAEANATPDDVSPDPWCGPVGRRPRAAFNRYRDVLVGHFVLVRLEDPHIHPVRYGRVIQPPHLNRSSEWYGMFQIRYWKPVRGTRDLSKRERYENCWSARWEYDCSVQALQWVQCSDVLYASPPYSNFTDRKRRKIPEADAQEARRVLVSAIAVHHEGGSRPPLATAMD
jgi:hypothetical protein